MPKQISNKDLSPIEALLSERSEGLGIGEIEDALKGQGLSLNRRTLQRRSSRLEKEGRIQIVGAGRATRYLSVVSADKADESKDIITCCQCSKPATSLDHYWPWMSAMNLCDDHEYDPEMD